MVQRGDVVCAPSLGTFNNDVSRKVGSSETIRETCARNQRHVLGIDSPNIIVI